MRLKVRGWTWLALAVVLLVCLLFLRHDPAPQLSADSEAKEVRLAPSQVAEHSAIPILQLSRRSVRDAEGKPFAGAVNAEQFLRKLDASALAAGEKQHYRVMVASICDPQTRKSMDYIQKRDANKAVVSATKKLSSNFAYGYYKSFCNVPGIEMWREASGYEKIDPSDETLQSLELITMEDASQKALASQRALDLMSNATSVEAVSRAMGYLVDVDQAAPLGSDLPFPEATAQENFDAHLIAVERWRCEQRGGCGPGEFFSVAACQGLSNCRPGITAAAAWREGYRRGVLARAEEIHRRLMALHAKSQASQRSN